MKNHKPEDDGSQRGVDTAPLTALRPELLSDGNDQEFRQLIHSLFTFSAQLETVRSGFASVIGLSNVQYTILVSVAHLQSEQAVEVNTIARQLHLVGSFVTAETGKLVKKGLIEKRVNPDDRRRVIMSVTPKGREKLTALAPIQQRVNDVLFESIQPGQLQELLRVFGELTQSGDRANVLLAYLVKSEDVMAS